MKYPWLILCLMLSVLGWGQTNIVEQVRYELKGNVAKTSTSYFYPNSPTLNRSMEAHFKNGYISTLHESFQSSNIQHIYQFNYQKNAQEFTLDYQRYYNSKKDLDSSSVFQRVNFGKLRYYYPKNELKIHRSRYPNSLDLSYTIANQTYQTILTKRSDSTITESNSFEDFLESTYNYQGQIIEQESSRKYLTRFTYNENGQISSRSSLEDLQKQSQSRPNTTVYFYENDAQGNWIKRVAISSAYKYQQKDNLWITLTTRKITYADGSVSGSSDYCETFVQKSIEKYKA